MADADDYMSDKYLQGMGERSSSSLIYNQADKRKIDAEKRKAEANEKMKEQYKSPRVLESEMRERLLASGITAENKGFEMLLKMGYKPGQGIGKNQTGRTEPISLIIKTNRKGLGSIEKKKPPKIKLNPTARLDNMRMDEFRNQLTMKKIEELMENDLYRSQKVCEQLDYNENITMPIKSFYWPEEDKKDNEDSDNNGQGMNSTNKNNDDQVGLSARNKLEMLTAYLRSKYFYCIWCGHTYNDANDLSGNCPGSNRDAH